MSPFDSAQGDIPFDSAQGDIPFDSARQLRSSLRVTIYYVDDAVQQRAVVIPSGVEG
jgi:hypothetical protein